MAETANTTQWPIEILTEIEIKQEYIEIKPECSEPIEEEEEINAERENAEVTENHIKEAIPYQLVQNVKAAVEDQTTEETGADDLTTVRLKQEWSDLVSSVNGTLDSNPQVNIGSYYDSYVYRALYIVLIIKHTGVEV